MAKIALRAYNQEIESLIEARQIDEAIAHCRHILKTFPKHIQTYRLLGKAFLESQRYADAGDILGRVLSSIPDDFIAHVGMSVIREDEGNLVEAIYHMERAFEVQPANKAIQEELRRLYGKRDGFEPLKVRLSRGALARMYAKGELYPQAIAELRAALAETPDRLDLRLLLARNFMRMGQRVEAADACNVLLRKLPYCLEANLIMADVLQNSERAADAVAYRRRVAVLDPYQAHISALIPDASRVPDGTVTVERLGWQPGMPLMAGDYQPEWATSLGVHVPEEYPGLDEFPDWLGGDKPKVSGPALVDEDGMTPIREEDAGLAGAEIPDWMQKAGWKPGLGEESVEPVDFEDETVDLLAGAEELSGLPEAELPDWVREIAPPDTTTATPADEWVSETPAGAQASEAELESLLDGAEVPEETPDWLKDLGSQAETPAFLAETAILGSSQVFDESETPEPEAAAADIPDWLKDLEPQTEVPDAAPAASPEEDIPDWLAAATPAGEETGDDVVTWLAEAAPEIAGEAGITENIEAAEGVLPDWLNMEGAERSAASEVVDEAGGEMESETQAGIEFPLSEAAPEQAAAAQAEMPEPGEDMDAAFAWLEGLAAKQGADEALFTAPEDRPEAPPEWVAASVEEIFPAEAVEGAGVDGEEGLQEIEAEAAEELGLPDWLQGVKPAEAEAEIPEIEAARVEELPDWLQEAKPAEVEREEELEPPETEITPAEDIPDWLKGVAAAGVAGVAASAVDAWQEESAEGEEEAAPVQELPDWLQEAKAVEIDAEVPEIEPAAVEELPGWLQEAKAVEVEAEAPVIEPVAAEELPDWLQEAKVMEVDAGDFPNLLQEAQAEVEEAEVPEIEATLEDQFETPEAEITPAEEIPDWLKGVAAAGVAGVAASAADSWQEEAAEAEAEAAPAEELPDWLQEAKPMEVDAGDFPNLLQEAQAEVEEAEIPEIEAAAVEELPDWLKEARGVEIEADDFADEATGDWTLEPSSAETPEEAVADGEILPDWLDSFKTEDAAAADLWQAGDVTAQEADAEPEAGAPAADDWLAALETPVEEGDTRPGRSMLATHLEFVEMEPMAADALPEEAEALPAEDLPEWLQEIAPAAGIAAVEEPSAELADDEDAIASLFAEPEDEIGRTPAWDTSAAEVSEAEVEEAEEIEAELLAEEIAPELVEQEDVLASLFAEPEEDVAETVTLSTPEEAEGVEAMVSEAEVEEAEEAEAEAREVSAAELVETDEIEAELLAEEAAPEVEEQQGGAAAMEAETIPEQPDIDISAAAAEMPDFGDDMEAAFAWLEGLAARQGADEALFTAPEDRPEAPPDWVASMVEEIPPAEFAPAAEELEEEFEEAVLDEVELREAELLDTELPAMIDDEGGEVSLEAEELLETLEVEPSAELTAEPAAEALEETLSEEAPTLELEALDVRAAWAGVENFIPEDEAAEDIAETAVEAPKPELPDWLQGLEQATEDVGLETGPETALEPEAWTPPEEQPEVEAQPVEETAEPAFIEPLDLNKAGLIDLERLPGVGFTLAQKILDQRDQIGPFNSVMDLGQIAGFTPDMLQELEGLVMVAAPTPSITAPHLRVEGPDDLLAARQTLMNGNVDAALEEYGKLIRQRRFLPDIVRDLQQAVEVNPREPAFWQALGDAYLRDDQVQPALEAYTRVEELLR